MSSWQPISLKSYRGVRAVTGERIRKLERPKLIRVTDYIAANLDQPINLRTLAGVVSQSPFHFAKSFRATTGVPPYTFVTDRRMDAAMTLLRTTRLPIRKVAARTGFSSLSHFSRSLSWRLGTEPAGVPCRSARLDHNKLRRLSSAAPIAENRHLPAWPRPIKFFP